MRLFLDSSVWFAATLSPRGGSAEVIRQASLGRHSIFISHHVIKEVVRNLQKKGDAKALRIFFDRFAATRPDVVHATPSGLKRARSVINKKDAPVLSAAKESGCEALVTLDRGHFFNPEVIRLAQPTRIVLPKDILQPE